MGTLYSLPVLSRINHTSKSSDGKRLVRAFSDDSWGLPYRGLGDSTWFLVSRFMDSRLRDSRTMTGLLWFAVGSTVRMSPELSWLWSLSVFCGKVRSLLGYG